MIETPLEALPEAFILAGENGAKAYVGLLCTALRSSVELVFFYLKQVI